MSTALSDSTLAALRKALTFEGEIRLRTKSVESYSLLGGGAKSVIAAEKECLDSGLALFDVRSEKEGRTAVAYVRITSTGVAKLLECTPAQEYAELLRIATPAHSAAIQLALASTVETQLASLDFHRAEIVAKEVALLEQFRNVVEARFGSLRSETEAIQKRKQYFEDLLKPPSVKPEVLNDGTPIPKLPIDPPKPGNEVEENYQRRICQELAELYNESPDGREAVERVFYMTGAMCQIGEIGSEVVFDGRFHQSTARVLPGTKCRISAPGWVYESPSGNPSYLVKIAVDPITGGGDK